MTGLLAVILLLAGVGASHAVVRIGEDRGGRIGTYVDKYQDLRSSGESEIAVSFMPSGPKISRCKSSG